MQQKTTLSSTQTATSFITHVPIGYLFIYGTKTKMGFQVSKQFKFNAAFFFFSVSVFFHYQSLSLSFKPHLPICQQDVLNK